MLSRMANHPWKGAWLGHVNHLNFQISGTAAGRVVRHVDRLRCCQLRWTVSVINWWWRSSVSSLSQWPSTPVSNTGGTASRGSVSGSGDMFLGHLMGQYCIAGCRLSASSDIVVCNARGRPAATERVGGPVIGRHLVKIILMRTQQ